MAGLTLEIGGYRSAEDSRAKDVVLGGERSVEVGRRDSHLFNRRAPAEVTNVHPTTLR